MFRIRRTRRRFVLSSYPDGAAEGESYSHPQTIPGESYSHPQTIPDTTEQMELHISSATQVGHQLALIGDEFNRRYHRTFEDALHHLARLVAVSVFQTWDATESVLRSFGNVWSSSWTKRIVAYGSWVCRLPGRCVCQKVLPAALLLAAFWWAMNHGL